MFNHLGFDATLLIYLAALFMLAMVVTEFCPVPAFKEGFTVPPIVGLLMLGWILYPTFLAFFATILHQPDMVSPCRARLD